MMFFLRGKGDRDTLSLFVEAQATLEQIQKLCKTKVSRAHFRAISKMGNFCAISLAILYGAKEGVIEFLIENFPNGLGADSAESLRFPANLLLYKSVQRTTEEKIRLLSLMLPAYPKALTHLDAVRTILQEALLGSFEDDITSLIIGQFLKHHPTGACVELRPDRMTLIQAQRATTILHNLGRLFCCPRIWEQDALLHLLQAIGTATFATNNAALGLSLPTQYFREAGSTAAVHFRSAMKGVSGVKEMHITHNFETISEFHDCYYATLVGALSTKAELNKISFGNGTLRLSSVKSLIGLFEAWETQSLEVKWDSSSIEEMFLTCTLKACKEAQGREIATNDIFISGNSEESLCKLCQLPVLKVLTLSQTPPSAQRGQSEKSIDFTQIVVNILGLSKLQTLKLENLKIDWSKLAGALGGDERLITLHITTTTENQDCYLQATSALSQVLIQDNFWLQEVTVSLELL